MQLESVPNEISAGQAFQVSNSWSVNSLVQCNPVPTDFNRILLVNGPFAINQTVQYSRTLVLHDYIVVRFMLIMVAWDNSTNFNIRIRDQNGRDLTQQYNVKYNPNIGKGIFYSM